MSREIILTIIFPALLGIFCSLYFQLLFRTHPEYTRKLQAFFVDKPCARYFPKIYQRIYQRRKEKMDKIRSDFCEQAEISLDEYEQEAVELLKLYTAYETRLNAFLLRGIQRENGEDRGHDSKLSN